MLTTKTVLVLGAGASVPYKFPTGAVLSEKIIDTLKIGNTGYDLLIQSGIAVDTEINSFREEFSTSGRH